MASLTSATTFLKLDGVLFCTGAASGLGRAVCLAFAELGSRVFATDINEQLLQSLVDTINAKFPERAMYAKLDVTDEGQIESAINACVQHFGRLDYAVNSAGLVVSGELTSIRDTKMSNFERLQKVDSSGIFACMKHQLRVMESQSIPNRPRASRGVIINLASKASVEGVRKFGAYCAAKHAVLGMTRVAALEAAELNIRVIAMCPGLIKTPGHVPAAKEVDDFLISTVPMSRWGIPDEITDGIIFLCSDMASYMTGNAFEIDGGACAR